MPPVPHLDRRTDLQLLGELRDLLADWGHLSLQFLIIRLETTRKRLQEIIRNRPDEFTIQQELVIYHEED